MTRKETKMKMTITMIPPNPITFTSSTATTLCAPLAVPQSSFFTDNTLRPLHKRRWSSLQRRTNITRRHIA